MNPNTIEYTPESPVKVDTTLNFIDNSTDPDGSIAIGIILLKRRNKRNR